MTGSLNIRALRAELTNEPTKAPSFCLFSLGDHQVHSEYNKKGGKNPEWNELFHFDLFGSEIILVVRIYREKHFIKDYLVGEGSIELWNLVDPKKTERWITLKQNTKVVGKILIQSEFVPQVGSNPDITLKHKDSFIEAYKKKLMDLYHNSGTKEKHSHDSGLKGTSETDKKKDSHTLDSKNPTAANTVIDSLAPTESVSIIDSSKNVVPINTVTTTEPLKTSAGIEKSMPATTEKPMPTTSTKSSKTRQEKQMTTIMEVFVNKIIDKMEHHSKAKPEKASKSKPHQHESKHHVHDKASLGSNKTVEAQKEAQISGGRPTTTSEVNLLDLS